MNTGSKFFAKYKDDETVQNSFSFSFGSDLTLNSNFYELSIDDNYINELKLFNVSFSPEIINPKIAREVLFLSIRSSDEKERKDSKTWNSLIFIGQNKIISKETFTPQKVEHDGKSYNIVISQAENLDEQSICEFLQKIVRKAISKSQKYNKIESGYISKEPYKTIQQIQLYNRFDISVFSENSNFSLFADSKHIDFRQKGGMKEILKNFWMVEKDANEHKDKIEKLLTSIPFSTNYGNKKLVSVTKIFWEQPKTVIYYGEKITIPKLYMQEYGIPIPESEPCAQVTRMVNGKQETECIPIGCLERVGLSPNEQNDPRFMNDYKKATTPSISDFMSTINAFIDSIRNSPVLSKYHITLGSSSSIT